MIEFVVEQLKRVRWISGHSFVESDGYHLDWSPEGSHRMMLLQIALKGNDGRQPVGLEGEDPGVSAAVTDFWEACVGQLSLKDEKEKLPAFVKIIKSWRPKADGAV